MSGGGNVMDREGIENLIQSLRRDLDQCVADSAPLEAEISRLRIEKNRIQAAVKALELTLAPVPTPDEVAALPDKPPGLVETIFSVVARSVGGVSRSTLPEIVASEVQSGSANPQRVVAVRVSQLIKSGRLILVGRRVCLPGTVVTALPVRGSDQERGER